VPGQVFHYVGSTTRPDPSAAASVDVVFLHGLGGDPWHTWGKDEESFWPSWLANDFPEVNVYTAGYNSSLFARAFAGDGPTLIDRSTMLLDSWVSRPVMAPTTIFITHSLGGLIVKQMLRRCNDAADGKHKSLISGIHGVVFIGTPHFGASAANLLQLTISQILSKSVKQLAYGEEQLVDLGEWFRNWAGSSNIVVRAYYETLKTKGIMVVDRMSANPNVHGCYPTAIDADHIGMCKPASREGQLYTSISAFIREAVASITCREFALNKAVAPSPVFISQDSISEISGVSSPRGEIVDLEPDVLVDYQNFTTAVPDDRRSLAEKLQEADRGYLVREAERKKERFNMTLQRHIAQPSAILRYTRLMSDLETRFNRHARRAIARGESLEAVDKIIQSDVVDPVVSAHNNSDHSTTSSLVESALFYLTGNCHLRWDNVED
jgi:protein SERAC1